jgi:hypothetical protein
MKKKMALQLINSKYYEASKYCVELIHSGKYAPGQVTAIAKKISMIVDLELSIKRGLDDYNKSIEKATEILAEIKDFIGNNNNSLVTA